MKDIEHSVFFPLYVNGTLAQPNGLSLYIQPQPSATVNLPQLIDAIFDDLALAKTHRFDTTYAYIRRSGHLPTVITHSSLIAPPLNSMRALRNFIENREISECASSLHHQSAFVVKLPENYGGYRIRFIENPNRIDNAKWMSVIVAFASSQTNQFSSYPYDNLNTLALNVRLVYAKYEDEMSLPSHLENLPVTQLKFSRGSAHRTLAAWVTTTLLYFC